MATSIQTQVKINTKIEKLNKMQFEIPQELRDALDFMSKKDGFSSPYEAARILIKGYTRGSIKIKDAFIDPWGDLTLKERAKLIEMQQDFENAIENGKEGEDYFEANSAEEHFKQLGI